MNADGTYTADATADYIAAASDLQNELKDAALKAEETARIANDFWNLANGELTVDAGITNIELDGTDMDVDNMTADFIGAQDVVASDLSADEADVDDLQADDVIAGEINVGTLDASTLEFTSGTGTNLTVTGVITGNLTGRRLL